MNQALQTADDVGLSVICRLDCSPTKSIQLTASTPLGRGAHVGNLRPALNHSVRVARPTLDMDTRGFRVVKLKGAQ